MRQRVRVGALALGASLALASNQAASAGSEAGGAPLTAAAVATDQAVAWQVDVAHTASQTSDPLAPPLVQSWADDLGGSVAYPLIAAGHVYTTVRAQGSTRLVALDAATGQLNWMLDLGGGRQAANISYENGSVFVANATGILMAVDAQTGARRWATVGGGTMVTALNGTVYTGISAYDEATGAVLWRAQPAGTNPPPLQGTAGAALTASNMYLSTGCADAWDFDTATGREIWHVVSGCTSGYLSTPTVFSGRVYARGGSGSLILDALSGRQVGTFQQGPAPAFDGNQGFFLEGPAPFTLRARTLDGSTANWSFTGDGQLITSPIAVNGVVYVGSQTGNLYGLSESNGAQLFADNVGSGFRSPTEDPLGTLDTMAAGLGMLVVPASHRLVAYVSGPAASRGARASTGGLRSVHPVAIVGTGGLLASPRVRSTATRAAVPNDPAVSYQIDAQHTGVQPSDPITPPLRKRWSTDLGAGTVSYPVIASGKVFVTSAPACPPNATCSGSNLYALDQSSGQVVWGPVALGNTQYNFSASTWDAGRLFVFDGDGRLRAFDDQTGNVIWSRSYGINPGLYGAPPVVRNGIVYIKATLSGTGGALIAARESDGTAAWGNTDGFGDRGAPAVATDAVYVSRNNGEPTRIDLYGSTRWGHAGAPDDAMTPVLAGSAIYGRQVAPLGTNGYTWKTQDGNIAGVFTADVAPAIDGLVGLFMSRGILQQESVSDNRINWEFGGDGQLVGAPVVAGQTVYQGSATGNLYALDEASGHVLWSGAAGAPILAPDEHNPRQLTGMAIGNGLLVVPASTRVTAFETAGPESLVAFPALSNGAYGGYVSEAVITNAGNAPASVSIKYYDESGNAVGAGDANVTLPVNASWLVRQDNGHSFAAGKAGSGLIFSDQPLAAFVNEFAPGNSGDGSSYTSIDSRRDAGTTLYAPAIANAAYGGYTTGIGLVNLGGSPTTVTITYRDGAGNPVKVAGVAALASHAYIGLYSGDPALGLPTGFSGTATITSDDGEPLAAVVNEVGPGGQFSSYHAVAGGSTRLQAPTALNNADGGYFTGMGVENTSPSDGMISITYYDSAGSATVRTAAIKANGYLGIYQGDNKLGPAPSSNGYTAVLGSTVPIAAIVNEVAPPGRAQSTAYNTFAGGAAAAHMALVENAGQDGFSTGLGVMNTSTAPETVTLVYYDADTGLQIGNRSQQMLAPNAFWGVYQPTAGISPGVRATATVFTSNPGEVAVVCNEQASGSFMSYAGQ